MEAVAPPAPTQPPSGPTLGLVGAVDHVSHRIVRGWAWSPDLPRRRLQLDVFHRDVYLGRASAGIFRPDLHHAGLGDGHCGFVFHLPADVPEPFDRSDLRIATAGPERHMLPPPEEAIAGRATPALPACHRQVLGPLLAALRDAHIDGIDGKPGRRARIEMLCAPAAASGVSAFVEHIASKYQREELASGDADGLWRWYLGTYVMERGARLAPLSRDDIANLSRQRGERGALATELFAEEIAGDGAATYRWAIETSRRLGVEDCLVARTEAAALRATSTKAMFVRYPLSAFMHTARQEIAILAQMPIGRWVERRRVYVLVMLLALRDPHLLLYMPRLWLWRLLRAPRLFAATQVELFGDAPTLPLDRYRAHLSASGFDPARRTFAPRRYAGHRVRGGPNVICGERPVDVQIFGPLSRRLGLGESARRIATALAATPFSLNVVDYDIGNVSPADESDGLRFGPPRAARLNILHLNAEEIPEALAYLLDVFAGAPLVMIPYWELNRPAAVHRLGMSLVDEIWVASRFLVDVFGDAQKPVHCIGMSASEAPAPSEADCQALRARLGLAPNTFVFLTTSDALSWAQRKNPHGVVEAFRAAFPGGEDVALVVKTQNLDGPLTARQREHWGEIRALCEADARITLINESFDAATQRTLLAACDGFVSLHRAEGLGLDAIDALALGRSVVATAYSGTADLCTAETAWPIAADLVPVDSQDYCFVEPGHAWAEPRLDAACDALRCLVRDASARERKIAGGRALVAERASGVAYARRLEARVRGLLG